MDRLEPGLGGHATPSIGPRPLEASGWKDRLLERNTTLHSCWNQHASLATQALHNAQPLVRHPQPPRSQSWPRGGIVMDLPRSLRCRPQAAHGSSSQPWHQPLSLLGIGGGTNPSLPAGGVPLASPPLLSGTLFAALGVLPTLRSPPPGMRREAASPPARTPGRCGPTHPAGLRLVKWCKCLCASTGSVSRDLSPQ